MKKATKTNNLKSWCELNGRCDLIAEWDFSNNKKDPEEYLPASNQSVFWLCQECRNQYAAKISNRTLLGRGCPYCSNKKIKIGFNDLATTHPDIAKEWNHERNHLLTPEMVTHGSGKKVWWICPEGHEYQATVLHRTNGNGTKCPICNSGRQTSFAEQAIYYYVKKLHPDAISRYTDQKMLGRFELDIYIPSIKLAIEYDGEAWHKDEKKERELRKKELCEDNGIKLIRIKERLSEYDRSTADHILHMENAYEHRNLEKLVSLLADTLDSESSMWTRKDPRKIHSSLDVDIRRDEQEIRSFMTKAKGSLGELHPELAKEWNTEKNGNISPWMVKPGTDAKYWWTCSECGNVYTASPSHRKSGSGCPKCGIKKNYRARMKKVAKIDPTTDEIVEVFDSISEASMKTGATIANICLVCKGTAGRIKASGYKWKYID